ncbi:MAG: proton-conducting transporter membrane subunit [Rhodopila sp.]|nr:proton-conducting transporter membrane subunit [Rhodopila sp.]
MSDPILLFLVVDIVALLLLGACAAAMPLAITGFLATGLCGLGTLLCLPPLLVRMPATVLDLPLGPPSLPLHLALDPLSAFFLLIAFLCGTAVAAFQATTAPLADAESVWVTAFCLAGTATFLLAADGITLAIGVALACGAIWLSRNNRHRQAVLLVPLLFLTATCLLTPSGFAPRFDAIRTAPIDSDHAAAATALAIAAVAGLILGRSADRGWTRDALIAGALIPSASYLLLRLVADLSGGAAQNGWGFVLVIIGGALAIIQSWHSAATPDLDAAVAGLARRQAGLSMAGVGLVLIARAADLPGAASFGLAAVLLLAIGGSVAGSLTALAAHAIGTSAGTYRLSRLGGLVHAMPGTSASLAVGLLALSALPPGLGFACLWLLFQSILSAPRTGGLLSQLPLALVAAAIAVSAALATVTSVRLIGIAVLGRPRSPRGAGARESKSPTRAILLVLAGISLVVGVLPGPALWLLAEPAIRALTGVPPGSRAGLALLSASASSPGYLALPVLALLALATGAVTIALRWSRKESRAAGLWADGMEPPVGLPFGDPVAQSTGAGFLPALPVLALPRLPPIPSVPLPRAWSAVGGLWLVLAAFGALLLALSVMG